LKELGEKISKSGKKKKRKKLRYFYIYIYSIRKYVLFKERREAKRKGKKKEKKEGWSKRDLFLLYLKGDNKIKKKMEKKKNWKWSNGFPKGVLFFQHGDKTIFKKHKVLQWAIVHCTLLSSVHLSLGLIFTGHKGGECMCGMRILSFSLFLFFFLLIFDQAVENIKKKNKRK
jgi:hypothetical protein